MQPLQNPATVKIPVTTTNPATTTLEHMFPDVLEWSLSHLSIYLCASIASWMIKSGSRVVVSTHTSFNRFLQIPRLVSCEDRSTLLSAHLPLPCQPEIHPSMFWSMLLPWRSTCRFSRVERAQSLMSKNSAEASAARRPSREGRMQC